MNTPEQPEQTPEQQPAPALSSTLLQLLQLRGSPSDLPVSGGLLFRLVLMNLVLLSFAPVDPDQSVIAPIVVALGLQLALTWLLLHQLGKGERFVQTATGWFGVDLLLTLIQLPLVIYITQFVEVDPVPAGAQMAVSLLLVVAVWSLMVFGHIFRCALEMRMLAGVLIALSMLIARYLATQWMFGSPV